MPSAFNALGGSVTCCAAVLIDSGNSKLNPTPETAVPLGTEIATIFETVLPTVPLKSTITPALLPEPDATPVSLEDELADEEDADVVEAAVDAAGATGVEVTTDATVTVEATEAEGAEESPVVTALETTGAFATTNRGADAMTFVEFTLDTTGAVTDDCVLATICMVFF